LPYETGSYDQAYDHGTVLIAICFVSYKFPLLNNNSNNSNKKQEEIKNKK